MAITRIMEGSPLSISIKGVQLKNFEKWRAVKFKAPLLFMSIAHIYFHSRAACQILLRVYLSHFFLLFSGRNVEN